MPNININNFRPGFYSTPNSRIEAPDLTGQPLRRPLETTPGTEITPSPLGIFPTPQPQPAADTFRPAPREEIGQDLDRFMQARRRFGRDSQIP